MGDYMPECRTGIYTHDFPGIAILDAGREKEAVDRSSAGRAAIRTGSAAP